MFSTGFSMDVGAHRAAAGRPVRGVPARRRARALDCGSSRACRRRGSRGRATWRCSAAPDGSVSRYAKIHPFTFGGEHRVYEGGDRIVTARVGDLRGHAVRLLRPALPEPFRLAAPETDLFAVVANWPDARREAWRTLLRARAIENLCFVAGVNRAGEGGGLRYAGDSALISPWGDVSRGGGPGGDGARRRRGLRGGGATRARSFPRWRTAGPRPTAADGS
jgi:hypothetical protein